VDPVDFLMEVGAPPKRGAKGNKRLPGEALPIPNMTILRELGPADAGDILAPPEDLAPIPTIARLRARHHAVAKLLAEGRKPGEVAAIMGYAAGTLSSLQADPAFRELINYYTTQVEARYLGVHERLAHLSDQAVAELQDRLEDAPQKFSNRELKELAEMALDRTGFAPKTQGPPGGQVALPIGLNITFVQSPQSPGSHSHVTEGFTIEGTSLGQDGQ
jgi:hypothetical protein